MPVHVSAVSQRASLAGRHTWVLGAKLHWSVQHALLSGSHTALFLNLHVCASQQVELEPKPGSQSSPDSTMPLPHICSVINGFAAVNDVGAFGSTRQVVFMDTLVINEPVREVEWGSTAAAR